MARCWSIQHIGNIVANLYQGKDKNGSLIMDSEGDLGELLGMEPLGSESVFVQWPRGHS